MNRSKATRRSFGFYGGRLYVPYLHAPGGRWVAQVPKPEEQVFTFADLDTGEVLHFDVQRLLFLIERNKPPFGRIELVEGSLEAEDVEQICRQREVSEAGMARIDAARLEVPGILCDRGGGKSILCDGNHRYVRRFRDGWTSMKFWFLTPEQWQLGLLDLPEEAARHLLGEPNAGSVKP